MKRILGFLTTSFLVLAIAGTGFAFQEDMMKKQTNMMSKKLTMSKYRKQTKRHKVYRHRKSKKIIRKSTIN